ncbi:hypothetical protein ICJ04_00080 [Stenotrophomonas sp. 169]|uniref:helix-turn-helix domain-containing transcriptional regulator n=1 Tax=Stenotrophomonas sp. 169 TaxID=2770322 RepID=UPI001662456C|nr:hypothetical protein [Stenotrophomonas sp. 169]QNR97371.1 hypothetical protein ICJ04_00080 [Stenotrophomonas sp. 169]
MTPPRATMTHAEMEAAGHFDRPRTPQAVVDYLNECIVESQGDAAILGEALAYVAGEEGLRGIARECGLPAAVVHRQLGGRRTLTLRTVMGALRAIGLQMRVDVAERQASDGRCAADGSAAPCSASEVA